MLEFFVAAAAAATLAGAHLPRTIDLGGHTLELVSCGVRDTLWIDHYVAGLYVPQGAGAAAAEDSRLPKALRMHVVQSRFLPADIPARWRGALESELAHEPMQRVRRVYDALSDGDVVTFTYLSEEGVVMRVNGRRMLRSPGHAVIDSILRAWAEKDAVSGKLQRLEFKHPC